MRAGVPPPGIMDPTFHFTYVLRCHDGGLYVGHTSDLDARVLKSDGSVFDGLYAAGEAAGFGGGGVHGYRSLEGTFLGGCIFSGRAAGRAVARG